MNLIFNSDIVNLLLNTFSFFFFFFFFFFVVVVVVVWSAFIMSG